MRERTLEDISPFVRKTHNEAYIRGVLDACNMANEYDYTSTHLIGDRILAKRNFLIGRIRRNPRLKKGTE